MSVINLNNPAHPGHRNQLIPTHGRGAERIWDDPLDKQIQDLLTAGCLNSNKERCGFVSEDQDIWYVDNVHREPTHNFLMCAEDLRKVVAEIYDARQTKILGIFHTHPNNVTWPTPRDLVGWPNPALGWRYWIVTNTDVLEWKLVTNG